MLTSYNASHLDKTVLAVINVFVYGTLQPEAVNDWVCRDSVVTVQPAIAYGYLFALPFGYPAMTSGAGIVHGVSLSFPSTNILERLDAFERHDPDVFYRYAPDQSIEQNQYERQGIKTYDEAQNYLGFASAYLMTAEQIHRLGGVFLPNGRWLVQP